MGPPRTTIATAESCTGGLLGAILTAVPGSSSVYLGGVVAYANSSKHNLLGVPAATLTRWGAVSPQVAAAMAAGVRELMGAGIGVGITGVAGPGSSETKPAGLIFVAVASGRGTRLEMRDDDLGREANRSAAVELALGLLEQELAL